MELKPGYKLTEVGVIPEDWDVKSFATLFTFQNGVNADKSSYGQGVRFINVLEPITYSHIHGSEIQGQVTLPEPVIVIYAVRRGDILFNRTSETQEEVGLAAVYLGTERVVFGGFVIRGRPMGEDLDPVYAGYALRSPLIRSQIIPLGQGAIRANIGQQNLRIVLAPIPPLPEQRSIATALSDMDELLGTLDRLIAKKRDLKQATMQQLLTGKTRLPGFGEGKGYQQTEVGTIPKDWDYLPLGHFITEFRGGAPLKPTDFTQAGVKVLPKGGVVRGGLLTIDEKDLQFCSQNYANKYGKNQVDESYTIVVLRDLVPSGPSIGLVVRIGEPERYVLAQGVYGFKLKEGVIPEYLIQYSNSFPYRRLMNEIMVGSTQVHITNTAFQAANIPFPNIEEQRAIATILSDMDAEIAALEQRRDKTRALKQAMMQELLTGRTRLV